MVSARSPNPLRSGSIPERPALRGPGPADDECGEEAKV